MGKQFIVSGFVFLTAVGLVPAQQAPDLDFKPPISKPAYESGKGPRIAVDEAHHNFHTAGERYKPFAELLRRDGYRVDGLSKKLSADALSAVNVLVIANPLNERNVTDWSLPTPSAFAKDEIAALRTWVEKGGSLFLIADHMPFPGAAGDLAKAFGVEFSNGYARAGHWQRGKTDTFDAKTGLKESAVTRGRNESEQVTSVATFGGSAFKPPKGAIPVLVFGDKSISMETKKAPGISADAAEVAIDGWCQGAVFAVEKGRVAIFGEAAMFTAQVAGAKKQPMGMNHLDAKENYQLLLNLMHWLTRVKGLRE
jgi:hypothetical protein